MHRLLGEVRMVRRVEWGEWMQECSAAGFEKGDGS